MVRGSLQPKNLHKQALIQEKALILLEGMWKSDGGKEAEKEKFVLQMTGFIDYEIVVDL